MAEEVDNESSEYEGDESITDSVNAAIHEDDMLRGFRMFHNLSDGIEHELVDIDDEKFYQAFLEQDAIDAADLNVIDQNNNNSTENQGNADQEPNWQYWDNVANATAERDAQRDAERHAEHDALTQNQSIPDQETE